MAEMEIKRSIATREKAVKWLKRIALITAGFIGGYGFARMTQQTGCCECNMIENEAIDAPEE